VSELFPELYQLADTKGTQLVITFTVPVNIKKKHLEFLRTIIKPAQNLVTKSAMFQAIKIMN